jgi:hypothetical protein
MQNNIILSQNLTNEMLSYLIYHMTLSEIYCCIFNRKYKIAIEKVWADAGKSTAGIIPYNEWNAQIFPYYFEKD